MWGGKDTSVSFCEEPYKESNYIAEYYNTLSGSSYVIIAIPYLRTKVTSLAIISIFLGIGTMLLHMTQRVYGQILDELSMILLSYGILSKLNKTYKPKYGISLIIIYLCFYDNFIIFLTMFITTLLCIVKETKNLKNQKHMRTLFLLVMSLGTSCWVFDQLICTYVKQYYLHAWWHVCTSISIYIGLYCINDSIQDSNSKISHSGKSQ